VFGPPAWLRSPTNYPRLAPPPPESGRGACAQSVRCRWRTWGAWEEWGLAEKTRKRAPGLRAPRALVGGRSLLGRSRRPPRRAASRAEASTLVPRAVTRSHPGEHPGPKVNEGLKQRFQADDARQLDPASTARPRVTSSPRGQRQSVARAATAKPGGGRLAAERAGGAKVRSSQLPPTRQGASGRIRGGSLQLVTGRNAAVAKSSFQGPLRLRRVRRSSSAFQRKPATGKTSYRGEKVKGMPNGHMHWLNLRVPRRQLPLRERGTKYGNFTKGAARAAGLEGRRVRARRSRKLPQLQQNRPAPRTRRGYPPLAS